MPFKIGIVGAGWYGCHLASSLASLGFDITVFEQHSRVLHEASGNNQFRLHMGFHYARHHGTRQQSRDGFLRFIERYPTLSAPIAENIYAVPKNESLIDFNTYKLIMASSGIDFVELQQGSPLLADIDGAVQTGERVLLIAKARQYFQRRLEKNLRLGTRVTSIVDGPGGVEIEGERFDYLIDATWGQKIKPPIDIFYEPTLLLYYETKEAFPAITFVDGPLCSIYPTEDASIYTLSSVPHTPLGSFTTAKAARQALVDFNTATATEKRRLMEAQVLRNVPGFNDVFEFVGVQLSLKTKPIGRADDRSCYVNQTGRIFSVMSGKIDTIFHATERILSLIEAENSIVDPEPARTLRDDILISGVSNAG